MNETSIKVRMDSTTHEPPNTAAEIELNLPSGKYTSSNKGVIHEIEGVICNQIEFVANVVDCSTGVYYNRVKFSEVNGEVKNILVTRATCSNLKTFVEQLLDAGFHISHMKQVKIFLLELLKHYQPTGSIRLVAETGWHQIADTKLQAYVNADGKTYAPEGVPCNLELKGGPRDGYLKQGKLGEWKEFANLCKGNYHFMMMMCAGFAGFILKFSGHHNFILHFFGDTRAGKTATVLLANSIFGNSKTMSSWLTTSKSLTETGRLHHDSFLVLDEISQSEAKAASEAAYDLGNGKTMSRLKSDISQNTVNEFRLVGISTGEDSFRRHLQKKSLDVNPGQLLRIISIPAHPDKGMVTNHHDYEDKDEFCDDLYFAADNYYGTAGPAFIQKLVDNQSGLMQEITKVVNEIRKHILEENKVTEPTALQRSVAQSLAVCVCAAELAIKYRVLPWDTGAASTSAIVCFKAWNRNNNEEERNPLLDSFRSFLEEHRTKFIPLANYMPSNFTQIYTHTADGSNAFFVVPSHFEKTLCDGFGRDACVNALKKYNLLVLNTSRGGRTRQVPIPSKPEHGKPSFYVIRASIIDA